MFGFKNVNFTGLAFIAKIGKVGIEFSAGVVEEITFNVTNTASAHAAEIPENINIKIISKDKFITTTSAVVGSKIAQTKLVDIIVGATLNLGPPRLY